MATLQQISVSLDSRIPLEAMVLQRLHRLPRDRQNGWLRQLVLTGFHSDCQAIKSEQRQPAFSTSMRKTNTTSEQQGGRCAPVFNYQPIGAVADSLKGRTGTEPSEVPSANPAPKPFTHLKHVIGE
jgi:hypothetical protein